MSYTYSTWVAAIANFLVVPNYASDTNFQNAVPVIIDDSEQKLYRELQLLNTVTRDASAALSTNTRTFNLPSQNGIFVVTEGFNVITPAGTVNPDSGTRNALVPMAKETLTFSIRARRDQRFLNSTRWSRSNRSLLDHGRIKAIRSRR